MNSQIDFDKDFVTKKLVKKNHSYFKYALDLVDFVSLKSKMITKHGHKIYWKFLGQFNELEIKWYKNHAILHEAITLQTNCHLSRWRYVKTLPTYYEIYFSCLLTCQNIGISLDLI